MVRKSDNTKTASITKQAAPGTKNPSARPSRRTQPATPAIRRFLMVKSLPV